LDGEGGHDGVLEFLDQFFGLGTLDLHRGALLDGGELRLVVGEHVDALVEGPDEGVGVHAADEFEVRVLLEHEGHDLDEILDVGRIFLLLGVEVARDEHVVVQEHDRSVVVPVEQAVLLGSEPVEEGLGIALGGEAVPLGEDEGVFVCADGDVELVIKPFQVLDQQLVRLLHEHHVGVALLKPLLELLQLPLLIQEGLSKVGREMGSVGLHAELTCLVDVQDLVDAV